LISNKHKHLFQDWELIEWIEFNQLQGISHFYFYHQGTTNDIACILKEYATKGIVTVTPWDPNGLSRSQIRSNNMYVTIYDCFYRNMYSYKYLAKFDVDEYLVAKKHKNLIDLMEDEEKKDKNMASISFRNVFFYTEWPDNPKANGSKLLTMRKTSRTAFVHPDGTRSKYICKPTEVVEPGVHVLVETRTSQQKQVTLELDKGFSYHYRASCEKKFECLTLKSEVDTTMWKWKSALTEAMDKQNISRLCKLKPR
jgi:Glycosyltransferase family 92